MYSFLDSIKSNAFAQNSDCFIAVQLFYATSLIAVVVFLIKGTFACDTVFFSTFKT
jgi:hypothetical protein